jgi:hypothetical protein
MKDLQGLKQYSIQPLADQGKERADSLGVENVK